MNIAFIYNVRNCKPSLENKESMEDIEFDELSTINGIIDALKNLGHKVIQIEANIDAYMKLYKNRSKIDIAFNIAEGIKGSDREAQIPSILEMLEIPYVGSKPLAQSLCLNKAKTKEILERYNIATSPFQLFKSKKEKLDKSLKFPLFVKPNSEGSSKGILQKSFVRNVDELYKIVFEIIDTYKEPAIAEEYLPGKEFTIALIGNDPVEMLAPVEVDYGCLPSDYIPVDSYETKWIIDNPDSNFETAFCPKNLETNLLNKLNKICVQTKNALDVLDWCRIDVRLDSNGCPNILEINQIPGIIPDPIMNSRFPLAARNSGYTYEQMLEKIIRSACKRYSISY